MTTNLNSGQKKCPGSCPYSFQNDGSNIPHYLINLFLALDLFETPTKKQSTAGSRSFQAEGERSLCLHVVVLELHRQHRKISEHLQNEKCKEKINLLTWQNICSCVWAFKSRFVFVSDLSQVLRIQKII